MEVDSILITETPLPDLEDITGRAFLDQDKEEFCVKMLNGPQFVGRE